MVVSVVWRVENRVTVSESSVPVAKAPGASSVPVGIKVEVLTKVSRNVSWLNSVAGATPSRPLTATPLTMMIIIIIVSLGLRFSRWWAEGVSVGRSNAVIPASLGDRGFITPAETKRRELNKARTCENRISSYVDNDTGTRIGWGGNRDCWRYENTGSSLSFYTSTGRGSVGQSPDFWNYRISENIPNFSKFTLKSAHWSSRGNYRPASKLKV